MNFLENIFTTSLSGVWIRFVVVLYIQLRLSNPLIYWGLNISQCFDANFINVIACYRERDMAFFSLTEYGVAPLRVAAEREHVRVVRGDDDEGVVGAGHLQGHGHRVLQGQRVGQGAVGVVEVMGVVDAAACEKQITRTHI